MCDMPQPPQKSDEEKLADLARSAEPLMAQWVSAKKLSVKFEARVALRAIPYIFWAAVVGVVALTVVVAIMVMLGYSKEIPATLASVAGLIGTFFAGRASKK